MSATIEVKYFNTFLIKKLKNVVEATVKPTAPFANVPHGFTADSTPNGGYDWYIEESRIRGGYNNTIVDLGVKAYLDEPEPLQQHRFNSLIYSGVFNSRTGVNQTNQFSVGEDITKSTDPANGSIQKLYAEDTNLIIFQQNKVSKALIDKDAIYSAEGNASITSTPLVIGQVVAYAGEYGISNDPFSFAVFGYRKYFTDKARGCVLRLSRDGITEISSYGMHDFFRDELASCDKIRAGWDGHSKNYIISLQKSNGDYKTISFDESVLGWTSFYSYSPNFLTSLKNNFYSLKTTTNNGQGVWLHNAPAVANGPSYGKFYETTFDSDVTVILNKEPSLVKNFKTINYEGASGWELEPIIASSGDVSSAILPFTSPSDGLDAAGNPDGTVVALNTLESLEQNIWASNFKRKENKFFANLINVSPATGGEVLFGASFSGIKGFWSTVKVKLINANYPTTKKELFAVSSDIVESSY